MGDGVLVEDFAPEKSQLELFLKSFKSFWKEVEALVSGQGIRSWEGCALQIVLVTLGDHYYGGRRSPRRAGAQ